MSTQAGIGAGRVAGQDRWIAENVLCQLPDQPLHTLLDDFPDVARRHGPIRLLHAVNLYGRDGGLCATQKATTDSMRAAVGNGDADDGKTRLVQIQDNHDPDLTPLGFRRARALDRNVGDVYDFDQPVAFPLLFDILDRAFEMSRPGEFIVYTNSDICLQPHFYRVIRELIRCGFDAITVNRRTVGEGLSAYPAVFAQSEIGLSHPGFDCFVFSRDRYLSYMKSDVCIGVGGVMRALLFNMVAFSDAMLMLKNVSLTYHFGDDRRWEQPDRVEHTRFNLRTYLAALGELAQSPACRNRLRDFCLNHPERAESQAIFDNGKT